MSNDDKKEANTLLKISGKNFSCDCGCNVFHTHNGEYKTNEFHCNACGNQFIAKPYQNEESVDGKAKKQ